MASYNQRGTALLMVPQSAEIDPWTPERLKLRDWFRKNAPQLEAPYEASVRLLASPEFPARLYVLGHLVREIANGLPEAVAGRRVDKRFDSTAAIDALAESWLTEFPDATTFPEAEAPVPPLTSVSTPLVRQVSELVRDHRAVAQTNRDKTAILIDALRPGTLKLRPALEPVIREWANVVRWFVGRTHLPRDGAPKSVNEGELQRKVLQFEDGLRGITEGHFQVVREIDSILESFEPSADSLRRLMPFLGGAEQLRYFFAHPRLENPRWLVVLNERGFFAHSLEPIVEGGFETHMRWPASAYLVRMASHADAQEQVAKVASAIRTSNTIVRDDLISIALRLPCDLAAIVTPSLLDALEASHWRSAPVEKLGELITSLSRGTHRSQALQLLKALVHVAPDPRDRGLGGVLPPTPQLRIDPRSLDLTFSRHLPEIVMGLGYDALDVLSTALDSAIRLSRSPGHEDGTEDHSHIWRPRIDGGADDDACEVLLSAVLVAAEEIMRRDSGALPVVLDALARHRWPAFRRLELYLLARTSAPPNELLAARLLDRQLLDGLSTRREYRMLLGVAFGALTDVQKSRWLDWVETGVPEEQVRSFLERWQGSATDEDVGREQRRWQWDHLGPVCESLPSGWRERWHALRGEFGEAEPVDGTVHHGFVGAIGWESPLDEEGAQRLNPFELAEYLKAPRFEPGRPFSSPEGLRQMISRVVSTLPEPYAAGAHVFEGLAPTYVRGVLDGFAAASNEGRAFQWDGVLELAAWVVRQPIPESEPEWDHREDPSWGWARGTIVRLLEAGLKKEPSPLQQNNRPVVWGLIHSLSRDRDPQRRADALGATIHYATWTRLQSGQPWNGAGTLDDVPEVRAALNDAIEVGVLRAPAVYETVGHWLPWLIVMDEAWVRENLTQIFPLEPEYDAHWHAAWRAYLRAGAPIRDRAFELLRPVYELAVRRLDPNDPTERSFSPESDLADHLAVLYGRGVLGAASLLDDFFRNASPRLRKHFYWYVGHSLQEQTTPIPADVLKRFQDLWEVRAERMRTDSAVRSDLGSFAMWFHCDKFDVDWALLQVENVLREIGSIDQDHLVVERLARLATSRTSAAMRCFGLIVNGLTEPGPVHGWLDSAKSILAAALRSDDSATRNEAIEVFHQLGGLGFRANDLVPFSDDLGDPAAIPYFTWDHPMTVAEVRARLAQASESERSRLLGLILREAKDTDVWRFTTPREVAERWPQLERHLGKRRGLWHLLLEQWKEQGLLAS